MTLDLTVYAMLLSLANSWHSDRQKERSWHIIGPMIPACVGVIIPLATTNVAARYVGIFLMVRTALGDTSKVDLVWMDRLEHMHRTQYSFPGYELASRLSRREEQLQ